MTSEAEIHQLTLDQLRGLRKENQMFREALLTFSRQQLQILERLGSIEIAITGMRSDVALLENKNLDRHNEILNILCRLDEEGRSG